MRKWVGGLGLAAVLVGCSTEGDARPEQLWDPCQIPAEALAAVGVGPEVEDSDFTKPDWHHCTWRGDGFSLTAISTTHSFADVQANPESTDFRSVTVGARPAVSYLFSGDTRSGTCDVAFETSVGVLAIGVIVETSNPADPCDLAVGAANRLDPTLPR